MNIKVFYCNCLKSVNKLYYIFYLNFVAWTENDKVPKKYNILY